MTGAPAVSVWAALLCFSVSPLPLATEMGRDKTLTQPIAMQLSWIPSGGFRMGDLAGIGQSDEHPVRRVDVPGFWMMQTEVTVAMYQQFFTATGYDTPAGCGYFQQGWQNGPDLGWQDPGFSQRPDHPVTCVSWTDASVFAEWLSGESGLAFALPSEAQWEYAARAGTGTRYSHGDDATALCLFANGADQRASQDYPGFDVNGCEDGYTRTAPVASYQANSWGLYDVTGNVWEWVADCWSEDYSGAPRDGTAQELPECPRRGYRGGAYGDVPFYLRIALRNRAPVGERRDDVGFRLVVNRQ